jgi:hypothetical protein
MSSKFNLSLKDAALIQRMLKQNPIYNFLKNKENYRFCIGDVLVKSYGRVQADNTVKWVRETVSYLSPIPIRYMYVHEDETGIGFIKRLRSDGTLGKNLICIADSSIAGPTLIKYSLDDTYIKQSLLGEDFSIKKEFLDLNEYKKSIKKINRNSAIILKTKEEALEFINANLNAKSIYIATHISNFSNFYYESFTVKNKNSSMYEVDFLESSFSMDVDLDWFCYKYLFLNKPVTVRDYESK